MEQKSYIITGPTASGKSDFAHALAKRVGGVIINCDSVQVYRGIETLSASPLAGGSMCPPPWEGAHTPHIDNIPYRLFSITDGDAPLSAGLWADMAKKEYENTIAANKVPVFAGGTGFYLKALLDGMSPVPQIPPEVRKRARESASYEYLQQIDPAWAGKISPNDRQRIVRGIEVFLSTGRPLSEWQRAPRVPVISGPITKILILPDREMLRRRIAERMPALAKSAIAEVKDILEKSRRSVSEGGWDTALPVMKADGILEISRYLSGEISLDAAIDLWRAKICSHNMKHQYTWFKTNFQADIVIDHIPTDADIDIVLKK